MKFLRLKRPSRPKLPGWIQLPERIKRPLVAVIQAAIALMLRSLPWCQPKRLVPMKPYVNLHSPARKITKVAFPIFLGVFCLIYGFYFALTAPYLMVPFAAPIGLLLVLSIWALPDRPQAPTRALEFLFSAVLISLVLWPNYLALSLPGLPWITAIRLFGFPMAGLLLVCLSTSRSFREELSEALRSVPWLRQCFLIFVVMQFVTLPFSKSPADSISKALIQQVDWTSMFLVGVWVGRTPGRVQRYVNLIVLLAVPIFFLAYEEIHHHKVLWSSHVPSFLKINDPAAAASLGGAVRGATGLYRTKATFTTPLGLGEFMALLAPFAIHLAVTGRSHYVRAAGILVLLGAWICIRWADARLGVVGFLVTMLLYGMYWGLLRFRRNRRDLVAATIVFGYPAVFAIAAVGVTFVHRLHVLVFGGGEAAASNAARQNQLKMGIPKILMNPIGHGASQSGQSMGYGAGEFITVDNYWLTIGLDYGVAGLLTFLLIFLLTSSAGSRAMLQSADLADREYRLLLPLVISLSSFLVMKLVFSQPDSHALIFAITGMTVGLIFRARAAIAAAEVRAGIAPFTAIGALQSKRLISKKSPPAAPR